jgi:membrane associated rhomboid family serine protease
MDAVMKITALGCAIYLYRFVKRPKRSPVIVSALIIGMTSLTTGLQFVFPEVLSAFRRNPEALLAGEWWRMVTPLFVQSHGWRQCVGNGVAAIIFLPLAERLYGKRLWALYFVPGVTGEIFAYAAGSNGAGSSLGIAGVIGSLFAFVFLHRRELPGLAHVAAIFGLSAAVVLCLCRDNHGPPLLIGVLFASLIARLWPNLGLVAA